VKQSLIYLVRLQRMDQKILLLKKVGEEGPQKIAALEEEFALVEQTVTASLEREQELKKRRREVEGEIEERLEKIKNNNTRQYQIKNNEEYRALLKEVEYLKKSNSAAEEEVLGIMETLEKLVEENKRLAADLEVRRAELQKKKKEVENWIADSNKELEIIGIERHELIKVIPAKPMSVYERVYSRHNSRAVVPIVNGICQQCHLQIPPQQYNELQRNDTLMTCPNCNRIIYWKDHEDYKDL